MIRNTLWAALLASAAGVLAQTGGLQSYTPAVPQASTFNNYGGGGYGYGGGWGTVAGNAMQGMASVISAQGSANLSNSAAAINMTVAQKQYIQNRQLATDTYFQMRATQRAAVAAERGPPPTMEQLARLASEGVPKPISSSELNPVSGQVSWPELLQDDRFAAERATLEQLVVKKAQYGHLGLSDTNQAGQAMEAMSTKLAAQIRDVPPQLYVAAKSFLKSLMFDLTKAQL